MSDRKAHWEKVYGQKSPLEVSWYQKEPVLSLELILRSGVARDDSVIDVGGGASTLVDSLISTGFRNISVLDISERALESSKERLGDDARLVEWIESDITEFKSRHDYALWHDRAVFHFLKEKGDRERYIENLRKFLQPGGHLIIAAFAIGGPERCSGLDIVQYDAEKLMTELGDEFELIEETGEVHVTPASKEQKFSYFRIIKRF